MVAGRLWARWYGAEDWDAAMMKVLDIILNMFKNTVENNSLAQVCNV